MLHFKALRFFSVSKTLENQARLLNHACPNLVSPGLSPPSLCCFHVRSIVDIVECNARIHPDSCTKMKNQLSQCWFFSQREDALFQNWVIWKRDEKAGSFRSGKSLCRKPFTHSHPKATLQHLVNNSGWWICKVCCNQMMWYMAFCLYLSPYWFGFIHLEVDLSGSKKDRPVVLRSSSLPFFKATLGSIWLQELKELAFI